MPRPRQKKAPRFDNDPGHPGPDPSVPVPTIFTTTSKNPLLIGEIADHLLSFLESDLVACYDVCQLWRSLVPSHNSRYRTTRAPILVGETMHDTEGKTYFESIDKHPSFRATKFCFRNTRLGSPSVKKLLTKNGRVMEELELWYDSSPSPSLYLSRKHANNPYRSKNVVVEDDELRALLLRKTPNLKTLIIKELPKQSLAMDLFPLEHRSHATKLALTRIEVTTNCSTYEESVFLHRLFKVSEKLEELELVWSTRPGAGGFAHYLIRLLDNTGRLQQMKLLKFGFGTCDLFNLLSHPVSNLPVPQLRVFSYVIPRYWQQPWTIVELFLTQQSKALEHLDLEIYALLPSQLRLPAMPNLVQLKIKISFWNRTMSFEGRLAYALDFPQLRILGLGDCLRNYNEDEIYPEFGTPAPSVQVLQGIPLGVNQSLMARIGRLFPNLMIIRAKIPFESQNLLVSIWQFCPNVTELFLTLDTVRNPSPERNGQELSLDCLFSGIGEEECARLRKLSEENIERELAGYGKLNSGPSLRDLKKLEKLCIEGPSSSLCVRGSTRGALGLEAQAQSGGDLRLRLTDVFGYSTLLPVTLSPKFLFLQVPVGVAVLSSACVEQMCSSSIRKGLALGLVTQAKGMPNFKWKYLRLIRHGFGLGGLGAELPQEWYGL